MASNQMRLEVVLAAIDKVSGPFKRMMAGSKGLSEALRTSHAALKQLKVVQSNVADFRKLETQLAETGGALQAARRNMQQLQQQVASTDAPSRKLMNTLKQQAGAVGKLVEQENRQRAALSAQRASLEAAGISTHQLAMHERRLGAEIDRANNKIGAQGQQLKRLNQIQDRAASMHRAGMSATLHGAGAMYAGRRAIGMAGAPLKAAMAFESSMADVRKVVDMTDAEAAAMGRQIQSLSMQMPMAADGIASIVAAAGQAGVARGELVQFAKDATMMGVAFDTTADEAGQTMATWRTAFRMPQQEVMALAGKVNYLGNTGPANVQQISEIVTRIGALGEVAGLQSGPLAALGATVAGVGVKSEIGATGIKNVLLALTAGDSATKSQRTAFKMLGLEATTMAKAMQTDAAGSIVMVLEKLRQIPEAAQAGVLDQLFGKESIGAIAPLLTNIELLKSNLAKVNDESKYGASLQQEYAARIATSENSLQLIKNAAAVLAQTIGATLIPDFKAFAAQTAQVVQRIVAWVRENPELVKTIAKLAAVGATAVTVIGGLLVVAGTAAMAFSQVYQAVGLLTGGKGLMTIISTVRTLLPLLGAISGPVGWIIAGIAAVGFLIYKYWGPIKAFMVGLWDGISAAAQPVIGELSAAFEPLKPAFDWLLGALGDAWTWFKQLLSPVDATAGELQNAADYGRAMGMMLGDVLLPSIRTTITVVGFLFKALKTAFSWSPLAIIVSNWGAITAFFTGLVDRFRSLGGMIMNGLVGGLLGGLKKLAGTVFSIGDSAVGWFKQRLGIKSPSRVFAALGDYTMQGLAVGLQGSGNLPLQALSRVAGQLRTVGAGIAIGAAAMPAVAIDSRPAAAGSMQAQGRAGDTFHIHLHGVGGQAAADIAAEVRRAIEQLQRERDARSRSRLSDSGD